MSNVIKDFILFNWGSVNKEVYKDLSRTVGMSPFYVFRFSKGKMAKSVTDFKILNLLKDKGIIGGIRYKYK